MSRRRTAILISGRGSNMLSLLAAAAHEEYPARVVAVLSNRPQAPGLARAAAQGIHAEAIDHRDFAGRAGFERALDARLRALDVDLVCLAGYLRRFRVGSLWAGRTLNIHPALLPRFGGKGMYGMRVHEAVLAAGARESGCTVHEVDEEYDHGATLVERRCAVLPGDTPESLAARVHAEEIPAYPQAIAMMLERRACRPLAAEHAT